MDLILTVVECPPHANMLNHTKVFRSAGGVIGRADSNDWVLPDAERILSSRHFEIAFNNGQFSLLDHSTNGTFVNDGQAPLGPGNIHEIKAGDVFICGEYQLKVTLKAPPQEPAVPAGLGAVDFLDGGDRTTFNAATAAKQQAASSAHDLDSWLEPSAPKAPASSGQDWGAVVSGAVSAPASDPWGTSSDSQDASFLGDAPNSDPLAALNQSSTPPAAATPSGWDDNDDWWKSGSTPDNAPADQHQFRVPTPQSPAQPATPPAQDPFAAPDPFAASVASVQSDSVDSLFGVPAGDQPAPGATPMTSEQQPVLQPVLQPIDSPAPVPPGTNHSASPQSVSSGDVRQLASLLGVNNLNEQQLQSLMPEVSGIVNEAVTRLIDLLRARTAIKNELRVQHTMIQTVDNNPLKFSANSADAMKMMFANDASAFMRPQEAIRDSFDDLSDHQVAVLKGMHAAYEAMLKHFDPENLKRYINARESLLGNKDAKHWVGFEQYYKSLKGDYETTYNQLFGEEFARAYEKQLAELKNARALNRQ